MHLLFILSIWMVTVLGSPQCSSSVQAPFAAPGSPLSGDSPGYFAVDSPIPIGSLIIPMDNTLQSHKIDATSDASHNWFNLRAYGYVKELRKAKIPVEWIIKNFKDKDDNDLADVPCFPVNPPFLSPVTQNRNFPHGPFVVFPEYRDSALAILDVFQPSPPNANVRGFNVAVYQTTTATTGNIRQHLNNPQLIAVSDAGPNAFIHVNFLTAAGFIENIDFEYVTAEDIQSFHENTCYTILSEPHFIISNPGAYTEPARKFLESGGNLLAECEAIRTYETAHFLTTSGIIPLNNNGDPLEYPNPNVPFIQIEGDVDETTYGSVPDFRIDSAGRIIDDSFRVAQSQVDPNIIHAMSGKINGEGAGGVVFYLAGHLYLDDGFYNDPTNVNDLKQLNGIRMYLNSVTSQTFRPSTCTTGAFEGEITADIEDNPDTVLVGNTLEYTVTVSNDPCAGSVDNLVSVISLSNLVTFDINDLPADCSYDGGSHEITCSASSILHSGESVVYLIPVTPTTTGEILASVAATTTTSEYSILNNVDNEVSTAVAESFEATLLKSTSSLDVSSGQKIQYSVSLENTGTTDMTGIVIREAPTNVEIISADANFGFFDLISHEWTIGSVPPGIIATLTVNAVVFSDLESGTQVLNNVCIIESDQAPAIGPYPCATATSQVTSLQTEKTASPDEARVGDTIDFTLDITNSDSQEHTINVSDTLPSGLTLVPNSIFRFNKQTFTDTFDVDAVGANYASNFPNYDHTTQTYDTGAYYFEFNDNNNLANNLVEITNGVLDIATGYNIYFGGAMLFSMPSGIVNPKFVMEYKISGGTQFGINIFPNEFCSGTYENIWSGPDADIPDFITEVIDIPEFVIDVENAICIGFVNYGSDTAGTRFEMTSFSLTYFEKSSSPQGDDLGALANGLAVSPGDTQSWTYQATVNALAGGIDVVTNDVVVTSSNLPTTISAFADVEIEADITAEKSGSVASAANGETVTFTLNIQNESPDLRIVNIEDAIPNGLVYEPNSISAVQTTHTASVLSESFTVDGFASANYPSVVFGNLMEINDNNNWSSGDVRVTGGVIVHRADTAAVGFRIANIDLSDPAIVEVNVIYDYQRTGPTWVLQHFYQVGSDARVHVHPDLPGAVIADAGFLTNKISMASLLEKRSAQSNIEFLVASRNNLDNDDAASILLDNLTLEIVRQGTSSPAVNSPPMIATALNLNERDSIEITYNAIVTDPTAVSLTNTLTVTDTITTVSYVDTHTIDVVDAIADTAETTNLQPVDVTVLTNDIGNIDPFSVTIVNPPTAGTVTVNTITGVITYTPTSGGTDILTYSVCLINFPSTCDTAQIDFTNQAPPEAVDDNTTVDEDATVTITVLGNDSDPNGDSFTVTSNTGPAFGTVAFDGGCQCFDYTPNANYNGNDSFMYTITDTTGLSNTATVNIIVNPIVDPIVAVADSDTTLEDQSVIIDVVGNDENIDGSFSVTGSTDPSNGVIVLNPDETITYTPNPNFVGIDTFTYTITSDVDSGNSDTATVTIDVTSVNDPLVAENDSEITDEDVPVTIDVLSNDSNIDNDPITMSISSQATNGVAVVNGDNTITYTPNPNYNGSDSFEYTISGGGDSDTAIVDIAINPVVDVLLAVDDADSTLEDTPVDIDVLGNDVNDGGYVLTVTTGTDPTNGSISVNPDNTINYTPNPDYHGTDSFTYTISGNSESSTATVSVTIVSVNDGIVPMPDSETTLEDVPVIINVLDNDQNVDDDGLTITDTTDPANGTIQVNPDGTITYTPNDNYNGSDSFTYEITSGSGDIATATVDITITPVNDPIVAENDSETTLEDTPVDIAVLDNDSNIDG
eukprot:CAMPEP_0117056810 /NCGR_PEP_ID=MMETSP0472-20121206/39420_1 /TAXON_ID=693140 ORGANISM="Tiarina fusus, Strain LIS" /NCGR_SAMPLE_ID=MMETSP0472 /ASSEMBLY_ACC=CAM_ASM_000603 /LENGTH=1833 /DNA_ID=CAMNT_0004773411 /DNA_START=181 /DNA_END=5678 /DNA_ORIENTATION=+